MYFSKKKDRETLSSLETDWLRLDSNWDPFWQSTDGLDWNTFGKYLYLSFLCSIKIICNIVILRNTASSFASWFLTCKVLWWSDDWSVLKTFKWRRWDSFFWFSHRNIKEMFEKYDFERNTFLDFSQTFSNLRKKILFKVSSEGLVRKSI